MKKIFFILAFAFILFLAYIAFKIYSPKNSVEFSKEHLSKPLPCDLNTQDCKFNFKGKEVLISLNPKPLQALELTNLKLINLGEYQKLGIKIYGLNMYMGEIKPKLRALNSTDYESDIVLGACVLDTMRFRAEVMDDDKPIGFYFDFELRK